VLDFSGGAIFMGIVNVTPDSFSDGGKYLDHSAAIRHALELYESGAGIIDVGGESTRPGSGGVDANEELRRVVKVIEGIRALSGSVVISVDTNKTVVAKAAIDAGAEIVNDVFSAEDAGMVELLRETGAAVCIMHRQGNPKTMQNAPQYDDVVSEVFGYLRQRRLELIEAGIVPERIAIDPGIGFGKTTEHNWQLIRNISKFFEIGAPLLVGHSRKRFLLETFGNREEGTRIVTRVLLKEGVHVVRLHEVRNQTAPQNENVKINSLN
jgi:dihydropteroate synthase